MDTFGLTSVIQRREIELKKRREIARRQQESMKMDLLDAKLNTSAIIEETMIARREREVKSELDRIRDRGAADNGVKVERVLRLSVGALHPDSDRVILPEDVLQELTGNHLVTYPILFEIYSVSTQRRTHCGVLEFTGPKDSITVPEKVFHCLGLKGGFSGEVRVRYKVLPKCTSVSLKVPVSAFEVFPDFRVFLESSFRQQYATLTTGDELLAGGVVPMVVASTQPDSAVCIVDSDVNLDLVLVDDDAERKWKIGETIRINKASQRRLWIEGRMNSPEQEVIRLEASSTADIFVSFWPQTHANMFCFDLMETGRSICIPREEWKDRGYPEYITVGVNPIGQDEELELLALTEVIEKKHSSEFPESSVACHNCRRLVPVQSFPLHLLKCESDFRYCPGCERGIRKVVFESHSHCDQCMRPVGKGSEDAHQAEWHSPLKCVCSVTVTRATLAALLESECNCKPVICRFCSCPFPRGNIKNLDARDRIMGFNEHEASCGNRTEPCDICHKRERLKDMQFHMQAFHPQ